MTLRTTRAFVRGIWQIEDLPVRGGAKQCRATFVQVLDAGGVIPTWLVDKYAPRSLKVVQEAIDEFRQDVKIDAADREELSTLMGKCLSEETYSEEELALLQNVRRKFEGSLKGKKWKQLRSSDVFVTMESTFEEGGSAAGIGRAITVVDASIEDCAAWEVARMTRERMKEHYTFGGLGKSVVKLNNHSELFYSAFKFSALAPREFLVKDIWRKMDEDTMVVVYEDFEHDDFPVGGGKDFVRASSKSYYKYERLPEIEGIPQTRVTWCVQVDLKGLIPKALMNLKTSQTLGFLSTMRKKFDKSMDIDAGRRSTIAQKIMLEDQLERATGKSTLKQFEEVFEEKEGCESESSTTSFALANSLIHADQFGGHGWGRTSMQVKARVEVRRIV